MNFTDKLIEKVKQCKNHSVVGLDPRINYVPEEIQKQAFAKSTSEAEGIALAFLEYNKQIIDTICDLVAAVKPQIAFYEQYGLAGFRAYEETCRYARKKGLLVVADAKRGDIGSTAEAYSDYFLGNNPYSLENDCLTVNPYLGSESLEPFIKNCDANEKGIYILVKTSNKSSGEIQDLIAGEKTIYEHVAALVVKLGKNSIGNYGYSSVGAVVGATYPEQGEILRKIMKQNYFLVPGYGAQGGTATDIVNCFNEDGLGALINSSRGIIAAHQQEKYKDLVAQEGWTSAIRQATLYMREDINGALEKAGKLSW